MAEKRTAKVDMSRDDPAGQSVAAAIKQLKALSEPAQFVRSMLGAGKVTGSDRDGDATHHTLINQPVRDYPR